MKHWDEYIRRWFLTNIGCAIKSSALRETAKKVIFLVAWGDKALVVGPFFCGFPNKKSEIKKSNARKAFYLHEMGLRQYGETLFFTNLVLNYHLIYVV